jgi:4-hydroxy-tetrahydrodipicolinate synthase
MIQAFKEADIKKAQEIHYYLLPLIKALFIETNPIPVKPALALMGLCSSELRAPLSKMSEQNEEYLKTVLKNYNLI